MTVILFFAAVAVLLATVGIYAVVSFVVGGRTQEIGVRMALGARRVDVLGMVVWQSLPPILSGLGIGLGAALVLAELISSLLFGVRSREPGVFAGVAAGLAGVSTLASVIPAWRAARLNPLTALRNE